MRVLIAGCGYVGLALAKRLAAEGHEVWGIRRPGSDLTPLRAAGGNPLAVDLADPRQVEALQGGWDRVFHCVAPDDRSEGAYRTTYLATARNLAARFRREPQVRVVFTGSTSVYGQTDGSQVTEASAVRPGSATARVLLETEAVWLGEASGSVLRIAGIYGPGRHRLAALVRGELRMHGAGSRRMNLVHRDDLVDAALAVAERGTAARIYNVADGAPPTELEFYTWVCNRLGVGIPPAGAVGEGNRRATDKWVVAGRLREETGWRPGYPTFREGYGPLLGDWEQPALDTGPGFRDGSSRRCR